MNIRLKNLSEIIASGNDLFASKFNHLDIVMGIMDKNLRNQGMNADAITIDCSAVNKKIVILIHDDKVDTVDIALGNKEGDIYSSSEYSISEITETVIANLMEENFIS